MIKINLLKASIPQKDESEKVDFGGGRFSLKNLFDDLSQKVQGHSSEEKEDLAQDYQDVSPVQLLLKLVIVLSGIGALYYYENENIPKLQKQLDQHVQSYEAMKQFNGKAAAVVAEIKRMKENKRVIERQIESIGGLSRLRLKYIKVLDVIQQNMPEKMWVQNITTKSGVMILEGKALTENEISLFIDVLGKNVHFADVVLASSEDDAMMDSQGRKLKKFRINCTLEKS